MASQNSVEILFKATTSGFENVTRHLRAIERTTGLLGSALHRLKIAAQFYISFRIFGAIYKAINSLTSAIPDLIRRGEEWAAVLDDIQDATGMTALETSKLAGVAKLLGINVDGLGRQFAMFARGVIENEENLKKYGIRIRDANGDLRSTWEIFNSVRQAVSSYGKQLLSTSAMQQVFGKSGFQLLDMLQLTRPQFQALVQEAKEAGLFMSQAAINAAEAWKRTRAQLDSTITGLGSQILGGIAPVLSALVGGIAQSIQNNMKQIVDFVQRVIVVIAGFVSGLLGIEMNLNPLSRALQKVTGATTNAAAANRDFSGSSDDAAEATDRQRNAIEKQIDALDRQLKRLDRIEDRRRARREYQELMTDISEAKQELSDLRSEAILESGMSAVEAELARQAHAADIVDAQKRVGEAKKALADFQREQEIAAERRHLQTMRDRLQERLGDITSATASATRKLGDMFQALPESVGKGFDGVNVKIKNSLKELLADTQRSGREFRKHLENMTETLRDVFLGNETPVQSNGITIGFGPRTGGVIKSLSDLAGHIGNLVGIIGTLVSLMPNFTPPAGGPPGTKGAELIQKSTTPWWGDLESTFAALRSGAQALVGEDSGLLPSLVNTVAVGNQMDRSQWSRQERATQAPAAFPAPRQTAGSPAADRQADVDTIVSRMPEAVRQGISMGRGQVPASAVVGGGVGGGGFDFSKVGMGGATRWQSKDDVGDKVDRAMEKYMGASSDTLKVQMEQAGLLEYILGSTDAISTKDLNAIIKGRVPTDVERWSAGDVVGTNDINAQNIGAAIQQTGANNVAIGNSNFGAIQSMDSWMRTGNIGIDAGRSGRVQTQDLATSSIGAMTVQTGSSNLAVGNSNFGEIANMNDWMHSGNINVTTKGKSRVDIGDQLIHVDIAKVVISLVGAAAGGTVKAGTPTIVGERGPELMVPNANGTVYSNPQTMRMLGGSGSTNITLQLDPVTTPQLLSGRPASTTTRAAVGV